MSPEQAKGQAVGPRTDVYQLGVLAYKMLTRELPFQAENPFELIVHQLKTPPPSPKKLAPKTPDVLARLVVRMMSKDVDARPSVADVRGVFAQLREVRSKAPAPSRLSSVLIGLMLFAAGVITLGIFWMIERSRGPATTQVAPAAPAALAATPAVPSVPAPASGAIASGAIASGAPTPPTPPTPAPEVAAAPTPAPDIEMEPDSVAAPAEKKRDRDRDKDDEDEDKDDDGVVDDPEDLAAIPAGRPGAILFTLQVESEIEIDGETVAESSMGGRYEVSAGTHEIRVKAPGRQAVTRTVEVPSGGVAIISIEDDLNATE
jgi:serine/threonine-protein kinase